MYLACLQKSPPRMLVAGNEQELGHRGQAFGSISSEALIDGDCNKTLVSTDAE